MIKNGKCVGEKGTITRAEGGDELCDTWVGDRRPRGGTNVKPEVVIVGDRVELRGNTASGGESLTVETGQDMGSDDIGMDDGDRCDSVLING